MANRPAAHREMLTLAALALLALAPADVSASCGQHVALKDEQCVPCHEPPPPCHGPECGRREDGPPAAPTTVSRHQPQEGAIATDEPAAAPGLAGRLPSCDELPITHPAAPPEPPPRRA